MDVQMEYRLPRTSSIIDNNPRPALCNTQVLGNTSSRHQQVTKQGLVFWRCVTQRRNRPLRNH